MIYYWLHIIYLFIGSRFFWSKQKVTSDFTRTRFVSILDCDSLRFMANSKYLYYMDFSRFEKVFRSNLYQNTIKKGMYGVLGSQKIIYKKPLRRWTKFQITLKLEGWDNKWVYHKQTFTQNGDIHAIGYTKAGFWKNKKIQNMEVILGNCGHKSSPIISTEISNLFKDDRILLKN